VTDRFNEEFRRVHKETPRNSWMREVAARDHEVLWVETKCPRSRVWEDLRLVAFHGA
jgi:hypothetical protein